jgi:ATP-dependent Clp protease ATP-binding subunit ClpA
MNRIDKVVVFRRLQHEELRQILDLELGALQRRIDEGLGEHFTIKLTDEAKEFLLAEGIDHRYGARHLKRAIERFLVFPLANLSATGQVCTGDVVVVDVGEQRARLAFSLEPMVATATGSLIARQPRGDGSRLAA